MKRISKFTRPRQSLAAALRPDAERTPKEIAAYTPREVGDPALSAETNPKKFKSVIKVFLCKNFDFGRYVQCRICSTADYGRINWDCIRIRKNSDHYKIVFNEAKWPL
jgi:hypothetical protein